MSDHSKVKKKSPLTSLGTVAVSVVIGWVGGKFLDWLSAKLAAFWTTAPDGFLFWLVVPLLLLSWVCCLLLSKRKSDQLSGLMAYPDLESARHGDFLERLTGYSDELSIPENVDTVKKLAREIAVLIHLGLGLMGVALGLLIFLAPRVLG